MHDEHYPLEELKKETTFGAEGAETQRRVIPVIDLVDFDERKEQISDQLWDAACETGFFQLINHGIALDEIEDIFDLAEAFFDLPQELKEQCPLKGGGLNAGWEYKAQVRPSTKKADQKESYQVTRPNMDGVWPKDDWLPDFQKRALVYEEKCWHLGMKVLSCFALKLGFEEDFFTQVHLPDSSEYQSTLRLLHYLPMQTNEVREGEWRAGAHTDFDCLTLLFQKDGHGGLQVCPGTEADSGEWTSVEAKTGLITCNIGDMLMRWSDDELKSTLHRVRFPSRQEKVSSRYSIAFFLSGE